MVFDAFAVGDGRRFAYADGQKKGFHDLVPFTAFTSQRAAFAGQFKWLIRFCCDIAVPNQSRNGVVDRGVRHLEQPYKIVRTANRVLFNDFCDCFHIVFCHFRRMVRPSSLVHICHAVFFVNVFRKSSVNCTIPISPEFEKCSRQGLATKLVEAKLPES